MLSISSSSAARLNRSAESVASCAQVLGSGCRPQGSGPFGESGCSIHVGLTVDSCPKGSMYPNSRFLSWEWGFCIVSATYDKILQVFLNPKP